MYSAKSVNLNKPSGRSDGKAASPPLLKMRESPLRQDLSATAAILLRDPLWKYRESWSTASLVYSERI